MIQWQKSSFSGGGDGNECVEVACGDAELLLRESDNPGRTLRVAPSSLAAVVQWQKSSFSNGHDGANCVEVAALEGELLLRESDTPARLLHLTPTTLAALLHRLAPIASARGH
ncbi:DUF397 domain-containing protein [Streptomyces sp. NPDC050528]|uniref:DUF397 domain-containing protein n=1 Tax=unclassified Streptomyces TaxID=2593676 RepID=UPI0037947713